MADKGDSDDSNINRNLVTPKYKMAANMVNKVLRKLIEKCKAGETAMSICEAGDQLILEETGNVFKKDKDLKKGIAFPTCVSVNNCICHFSPLKSDKDLILADGDVVKLDLGVHLDGYIGVVAHTIVIGASKENKVTGRKAEVILAAYHAAEAALRLMKPGVQNNAVTEKIQKVSEQFKCKPVEGMLSHQLKQFRIDGEKSIIQNPTEAQRKEHEKCEFELHEVYAVDVLVSSGEGRGREMDTRTTVFKKTDETYQLKMKASRAFFNEMDKRFGTMPFTIRALDEEKKARMGVVECLNHKLVEPFTVLYEKEGEYVAQFKFTVLLVPTGSVKLTSGPMDLSIYETNLKLDEESIQTLLPQPGIKKSNRRRKKKPSDKTVDDEEKLPKEPTEKTAKEGAKKGTKQPKKSTKDATGTKSTNGDAGGKSTKEPAEKVAKEPAEKIAKGPAEKVAKEPAEKVAKEPNEKIAKDAAKKDSKKPKKNTKDATDKKNAKDVAKKGTKDVVDKKSTKDVVDKKITNEEPGTKITNEEPGSKQITNEEPGKKIANEEPGKKITNEEPGKKISSGEAVVEEPIKVKD